MIAKLLALAGIFGELSLLAVGGGNTVLPEMQRQVVTVHAWMSAADFAALFALAQASPGPNMLVSTLIGWRVAGLGGAIVATLGMILPSSLLSYAVGHLWTRFRDRAWRRRIQSGITPVTVGLVMAAAILLGEATSRTPADMLVTLAVALITTTTRLNPLWLLGAAAILGAAGLV
ncbi:MAG: chromate transporter [Rhodospirillales bacterium]|nr:chromate transporter [Rhodospirillales bacterium]